MGRWNGDEKERVKDNEKESEKDSGMGGHKRKRTRHASTYLTNVYGGFVFPARFQGN